MSNYTRNHKHPIPAAHENPRYTGKCLGGDAGCGLCSGRVKPQRTPEQAIRASAKSQGVKPCASA